MTFKKERAGIIAMVLLSQMILFLFVIDAALGKEVGIGEVLSLTYREILLTALTLGGAIAAYFLVPAKKRDLFIAGAFGLEGLFWIISTVFLALKKALGFPEILLVLFMLVLLAIAAVGHKSLAPKKEKGKWFRIRILASVCTVVLLFVSFFIALHYRNDFMRADVCLIMFGLCALSLLCFWWFADAANHVLTLMLILIQVVVYLVCFGKLCKNKERQALVGTVFKSSNLTHVLTMMAMLLVFLLAIAVLLQYLKNLQIAGKFASISFTCIVIGAFLLLGSIQDNFGDSTKIDAGEAVTTEEFSIFVRADDSAQSLADVSTYSIGCAAASSRINATKAAIAKLREEAGSNLDLREYGSLFAAAEALRNGEVKAIFIESLYADMIDDMYAAMEQENSFTGTTRAVAQILIPAVPDDDAPDPTPTVDPNATPTPTLGPNDPTPTLPPNDPSQPIAFKERPDNSGRDLSTTPFTVFISGIDTYGGISARSRSDVNLLMVVNPTTKEIGIVTTPRDSYVHIPGKTNRIMDKLTHAGIYGPQYSMATLEHLYGVPVDFYIRVNFSSVVKIVDVLGGVDAYSLYTFTSNDGYHFRQGLIHMNGTEALSFVREREHVPNGDYTRGKHQIEVIKGLINKMTSSKVLSNYESFMSAASKSFQTDISLSQIAQLVSMQMSDGAEWHITSYESVGDGAFRECDAMSGMSLYVALLKPESVRKSAELMIRVLNGDHIGDDEYKYDK